MAAIVIAMLAGFVIGRALGCADEIGVAVVGPCPTGAEDVASLRRQTEDLARSLQASCDRERENRARLIAAVRRGIDPVTSQIDSRWIDLVETGDAP